MPVFSPTFELLPKPSAAHESPPSSGRRRPLLFGVVFLACLAGSLAYVWSRDPVYQSTASMLTVAPAAIDEQEAPVNVQQIAVQRRTLLDVSLLQDTRQRLSSGVYSDHVARLALDELRGMLSVEPVAETNVLRLRARGPRPAVLAPVLNAWIDAYGAFRERTLREQKNQTFLALEEESERLGKRIEAKHRELDEFRRVHGILSKNDIDNQAMARLGGLNTALNKASDEEVQAKSKLDAIEAAIAKGDPVVPPSEAQGLAELQFSAHLLREQVKDLERRYTPQYIAMQPNLRVIPEQLEQAEADIRKMIGEGKQAALSEAKQAYASAVQSMQAIRKQIDAHGREAGEFTARFAEQEALEEEVKKLEEVYRDNQARLARVQARPDDKLPRYQVVERAYPPVAPLWPDYARDSGMALAGSLGAALMVLLIHDFLTRRDKGAASIAMPDIHVYSVPENLLLRHREAVPAALGEDRRPLALESPFPRELHPSEVVLLLDAANLGAKQLLGLLLSGLSLAEAAALEAENLDWAGNRLRIGGAMPRELPLAPRLKASLARTDGKPAWCSDTPPDSEELAAHIACAAADAGLTEPESVDAQALRHTYILYLVRRGIRLADLERVVGKMPVKSAAAYARFSPPGPGLRLEAIPLAYPALMAEDAAESRHP